MDILVRVPEVETQVNVNREYVIDLLASEMTISELFEVWPYVIEKESLRRELNGK